MNYRHCSFSLLVLIFNTALVIGQPTSDHSWIRVNLLGYKPEGIKVAVLCSKEDITVQSFQIVDAGTGKVVFENAAGKSYGAYGPFRQTYRLNFSAFNKSGMFRIKAGEVVSPSFPVGAEVYKGTADFSLQYMRQQRSGYNPFLKDSCHTQDGYTMYGPMPDSSHIDVSGGWHDATDYLQYTATSANATYHLLAAWRDFPEVFGDQHQANGTTGKNSIADVMDEARWGLDWLLKMHPRPDWMFNQLADDRDHVGFRLPANDKANYGKGKERPVYFITGEPQGLSKYKNKTTGTSSSAGKFSSAFSLGYQLLKKDDASYANTLKEKSKSAYTFAFRKQGNTQTASYLSPYIYAEDNWVDDMELAAAQQFPLTNDTQFIKASFDYAQQEKLSPWLGKDTASHYQWYPFINIGHFELAKVAAPKIKNQLIAFYKEGIEQILNKGKHNAFLRGVPFIWCSNNLQTSFAIQCYWYRELSGDETYAELEQATFDWLFGCNPWGTSMVVGLPSTGDFPDDAHSSLTILHGYQTLGSLVDGPVYGSIFKQQRGVTLVHGDEYAEFQSNLVVYHDDYGDYATNEPTMDGTASLIYLLAAAESKKSALKKKP
jgi:endoglucanase